MSWFGKIGHFVTSSVAGVICKFGHFGGDAIKQLGVFKSSYDNISNSVGGMIGKTLEGLPVVGPVLMGIGNFVNQKESLSMLDR